MEEPRTSPRLGAVRRRKYQAVTKGTTFHDLDVISDTEL